VARLALVVLELDFCVLERAGARAALDDTGELDEAGNYAKVLADFSS
jgi:hypothetical protein